jgi:hypothetical protein
MILFSFAPDPMSLQSCDPVILFSFQWWSDGGLMVVQEWSNGPVVVQWWSKGGPVVAQLWAGNGLVVIQW